MKPSSCSTVDLCCGMGGLSLGALHAGCKVSMGIDLNPHALKSFSNTFPFAKQFNNNIFDKNITKIIQREILTKKLMILSGPPCQGFSIAGPRNPDDVRNSVILRVGELINELQPEISIVENVGHILDNRNLLIVNQFRNSIIKGGLNIFEVTINAADYGVAQSRKRVFFIITKKTISIDNFLKHLDSFKQDHISTSQILNGLPRPKLRPDKYFEHLEEGQRYYNHFKMAHSERVIRKIRSIPIGKGPMSYRKLDPSKPANTLFSGHRAPPVHYRQHRSITVREAARLQGFPDDSRLFGPFSKQMEQVTNAVPPPLARAVILSTLKAHTS